MRIIFIHQNMPGQFRHVAAALHAEGGHEMVFVGTRRDRRIPGALMVPYALHRDVTPRLHPYLVRTERAVLYGQAVARKLVALSRQWGRPDLIVAHSGWGEALFVKDVYPSVPLLIYSEFYYKAEGADVGFESAEPVNVDVAARTRMRNTHMLQSLLAADRALTATTWQKSVHPAVFHDRIDVIHEGIDTAAMSPDPAAAVTVTDAHDGRTLTLAAGQPVITYVARNLEPYRGFHIFMRALPAVLDAHPDARVVIVGGDQVSYGSAPGTDHATWREAMLAEVALPRERVVFTGMVPYDTFRQILRVSRVHVYLTYPFVLSWSMLEAMSCGCLVVGSDTPPVREVIEPGVNGLLTSFHDPDALARQVTDVLGQPAAALAPLRESARRTILDHYDRPACLAQQRALLDSMADGLGAPPVAAGEPSA